MRPRGVPHGPATLSAGGLGRQCCLLAARGKSGGAAAGRAARRGAEEGWWGRRTASPATMASALAAAGGSSALGRVAAAARPLRRTVAPIPQAASSWRSACGSGGTAQCGGAVVVRLRGPRPPASGASGESVPSEGGGPASEPPSSEPTTTAGESGGPSPAAPPPPPLPSDDPQARPSPRRRRQPTLWARLGEALHPLQLLRGAGTVALWVLVMRFALGLVPAHRPAQHVLAAATPITPPAAAAAPVVVTTITITSVPYSEFLRRLASNEVHSAEIDGQHITYALRRSSPTPPRRGTSGPALGGNPEASPAATPSAPPQAVAQEA